MRCPECASIDDKVVDSRLSEDGQVTRRRRECLRCEHRFTTFERLDEQPALVAKSTGETVPFDAKKTMAGIQAATKGRPVGDDAIQQFVVGLEARATAANGAISSEQIGRDVLEWLARQDHVAYLRFASVYKGFDDPEDFQHEARLLKDTSG